MRFEHFRIRNTYNHSRMPPRQTKRQAGVNVERHGKPADPSRALYRLDVFTRVLECIQHRGTSLRLHCMNSRHSWHFFKTLHDRRIQPASTQRNEYMVDIGKLGTDLIGNSLHTPHPDRAVTKRRHHQSRPLTTTGRSS